MAVESIFTSQLPANNNQNDSTLYTLGTAWTPAVDGVVNGIRIYAPANTDSTRVGVLWSFTSEAAGTELARATFAPLTQLAWNEVAFAVPVAVTAGNYYIASYITPDHYVFTSGFFTSAATVNGNLTAPQSGVPVGNGRFHVGDGYPEVTSGAQSNYFADVLFEAAAGASVERWGIAL